MVHHFLPSVRFPILALVVKMFSDFECVTFLLLSLQSIHGCLVIYFVKDIGLARF